MTIAELKAAIIAELQAPVNAVQKIINCFMHVIDFFAESSTDSVIPEWTDAQTFQTDGSDDGEFCRYEDTSGNIRIWQTKGDDNIAHEPPTDPGLTENVYWLEVSPASGSSIKEWAAGIFGSGLIIVFHDHSTDGPGLYQLLEATRPFNSTNIETEITAGKWRLFSNKQLFKGYYTSVVNLESAVPVGEEGAYAIIDAGGGTDAQVYVWDGDEGWVLGSGSAIVFASQAEAETAADDTEVNRNNLISFTARSFRWAFNLLTTAHASAGSEIAFDRDRTYGTPSAPITATTLTETNTAAKVGQIQKIYHQAASFTPPATWTKLNSSYDYVPGVVNIIYVDHQDTTHKEYIILQYE